MDSKVFWQKGFVCPICSKKFNVYRVRQGSYETEKRDADFCIWYKGINPELYSIVVCPSCNYSTVPADFNIIDRRTANKLRQNFKPGTGNNEFSEMMNFNLAIKAHLLAIETYKLLPDTEAKIAGLYLKIGWFYRQQNKMEDELKYLALSMESYRKAYETARKFPEKLGDIGVAYLMGELNRRLGNNRDAVRWFNIAISNKKIKTRPDIEKLAREQWQATREGYMEETKAASQKIPFYKLALTPDEQRAISAYISSYLPDDFETVGKFEKMFAAYANKKFAYAFCHLKFALDSVCKAANLNAGEGVIIPAFAPLSLLAVLNGHDANIKVVDTGANSLNIETGEIIKAMASNIRLIFVAGFASGLADIKDLSKNRQRGTLIIELVLGAIGSKYGQDKAGALADITIYDLSSVSNINIPAGVVVTTNDEKMAKSIAVCMNHYSLGNITYQGLLSNGPKQSFAYHYGMSPLCAQFGIIGLSNADKYLEKLIAIDAAYRQAFKNFEDLGKIYIPSDQSGLNFFATQLKDQGEDIIEDILRKAQEQNIGIRRLPLPADVVLGQNICQNADKIQKTTLLLPMFPAMTHTDLEKVVSVITALI